MTNNKLSNEQNHESNYFSKPQWYVIQCKSGLENKVKENLKQKVETLNHEDKIFDIVILEDQKLAEAAKKVNIKRKVNKNTLPGYVFVKMCYDNDIWFLIRNTEGVTGFIGSSGKGMPPSPLSIKDEEVIEYRNNHEKKLTKVTNVKKDYSSQRNFDMGDYVQIISGALLGHEGTVLQLQDDKGIAAIETDFFGRKVLVKVEYACCQKEVT